MTKKQITFWIDGELNKKLMIKLARQEKKRTTILVDFIKKYVDEMNEEQQFTDLTNFKEEKPLLNFLDKTLKRSLTNK